MGRMLTATTGASEELLSLWIGVFHATSVPVDSVGSGRVMSTGRSSSLLSVAMKKYPLV
jgi:hypothetical protein